MKIINVNEAVGMVLGQDFTRIVPGQFKGVAFKKGHIIEENDIPLLKSMGKNHIYVMEMNPGYLHENDAAAQLARAVVQDKLNYMAAAEGKVDIKANCDGLLKIDSERLWQVNMLEDVALSTLHNDTPVRSGELVACIKIIPLTLPEERIKRAKEIAGNEPLIRVIPLMVKKAGLIITGNEVYHGLIEDKFEAVIKNKFTALGSQITETVFLPDDAERIAETVKALASKNDLVFITGGMSVDPDDVTLSGVKKAGAEIAAYGTPVLPGAMFLAAYLGKTAILGIPACGMFSKTTVLDIVLPKVLAGETLNRSYIASLGHGGLCRQCAEGCRYPDCSFGK